MHANHQISQVGCRFFADHWRLRTFTKISLQYFAVRFGSAQIFFRLRLPKLYGAVQTFSGSVFGGSGYGLRWLQLRLWKHRNWCNWPYSKRHGELCRALGHATDDHDLLSELLKPFACCSDKAESARTQKQEGLLSPTAQRSACETWNAHPSYWGRCI